MRVKPILPEKGFANLELIVFLVLGQYTMKRLQYDPYEDNEVNYDSGDDTLMIKDPPVFREKRKSERNALQCKKDRVKDGEHCQNVAESHLILNQPGCGQSSKGVGSSRLLHLISVIVSK